LQEVAHFPVTTEQAIAPTEPEPELTAGELFDGNISRLGKFAGGDLPPYDVDALKHRQV
jgi:hypothetical protein